MGFLSSRDVYSVPWAKRPVKTAAEATLRSISALPEDRTRRVKENERKRNDGNKILNAEKQMDDDNQLGGT